MTDLFKNVSDERIIDIVYVFAFVKLVCAQSVKPGLHIVVMVVSNGFDTREHLDYNIASLTGIVINCSVSSSCNDRSNH